MAGKLEQFLSKAIQLYSRGNSAHLGDRSQYIGASDIAGCPRKAVLSRQFPVEHSVTTQLRFSWGHLSQELFARLFKTGGLQFQEEVEIIHPHNPRIRCHIDFLFTGKDGRYHVVEKKATKEIPAEPHQSWVDQLQFQMGMLKHFYPGAKEAQIGGSVLAASPLPKEDPRKLVNGVKEFNSFTPNDLVFGHLQKKADHILAAIDGKEEARCEPSFICGVCPYNSSCPSQKSPDYEIPQDVITVAKAYLELNEQKKRLEADLEALKEDLLKYTGKSFSGMHDGVQIRSYTVKDGTTVDSKKLQKDFPEAFKACSKPRAGGTRLEITAVQPQQTEEQKLAA